MSIKGIQGNWDDGKNKIEVNLSMIHFMEDGIQVLYCPALDLSGYGGTEKEAFDSFQVSLDEFLFYTLRKGTLLIEMKRLGWEIKKKGKPMIPPNMQQLLENNDNFRRIFNNYSFRKFDQHVSIPAA